MSPSERADILFVVTGAPPWPTRAAVAVTTRRKGTMLRTLRELRVEQGMSLAQLAEQSGINKGTLSGIERGRIVANPAELAQIGAVFGRRLEVRTIAVYEEPGQ